MDINQVRFGNYSIGSNQTSAKKNNDKLNEQAKEEVKTQVAQEKSAEGVMSALNIAGMQNLAQVNVVAKKEVNPTDYLSEERIADIEAMMGGFELGVNQIADVIEDEFPGMLSSEQKMALAAQIFDQE